PLVVGLVALGCAWFVSRRARLAVAVVALALVGAAQTERALDGLARSPLAVAIPRHAPVTMPGVLADDPPRGPFGTAPAGRVAAGRTHRTVFAVATGDDALRLRVLEAGDRVTMSGRLEPLPPDGFDQRAKWRHAVARLDGVQLLA